MSVSTGRNIKISVVPPSPPSGLSCEGVWRLFWAVTDRCLSFQEASILVLDFTARPWHLPMTLGTAALCPPPQRGLETVLCQKAIPASSLSASPSPHQTFWSRCTSHSPSWTRPRSTRGKPGQICCVKTLWFRKACAHIPLNVFVKVAGLLQISDGAGCEGERGSSAPVQVPQLLWPQPKGQCVLHLSTYNHIYMMPNRIFHNQWLWLILWKSQTQIHFRAFILKNIG